MQIRIDGMKDEMYEFSQSNPYENGYVYFVLDVAASMVKIGYTTQIEARRFGQISSPYKGKDLRLLGIMPGGAAEEASLHTIFSNERDNRREWFKLSDRLAKFVEEQVEWVDPICVMGQHQLDGTFRQLKYTNYPPVLINNMSTFMKRRGLSVMEVAVKVGCFPSLIERAMTDTETIDVQLITALCYWYKAHPSELIGFYEGAS